MEKELLDFTKTMKSNLFASRDTLPEALKYAYAMIEKMQDSSYALIALHVVLNTIAQEIEKIVEKK